MPGQLRLVVSACLLGEPVRYDGGHRRSGFVAENLAEAFALVPECPELGIGLGAPRPKIRLEDGPQGIRLVGPGGDLTGAMDRYAERFRGSRFAGAVLKAGSPSCGTGDAKRFRNGRLAGADATGIFAGGLLGALPDLPVISERGLEDPAERDHWLTRVFAFAELEDAELPAFHARWRTALAAHSETAAARTDRLLRDPPAYRRAFLAGLAVRPTVESHCRVLIRLARSLDPEGRDAALAAVAAFAAGQVPLAAPVREIARRARPRQAYLAERPRSLRYREARTRS